MLTVDTAWFSENPRGYLKHPEFIRLDNHRLELNEQFMTGDMFHSLRRHHLALAKHLIKVSKKEVRIAPESVKYHENSLTKFSGSIHLAVMVGVVCGVDYQLAAILLKKIFKQLEPGGCLWVSASNERMHNTSPDNRFFSSICQRPGQSIAGLGPEFLLSGEYGKLVENRRFQRRWDLR